MKEKVNKDLVLKTVAKMVTDKKTVVSYLKGKAPIESLTSKGIKLVKAL